MLTVASAGFAHVPLSADVRVLQTMEHASIAASPVRAVPGDASLDSIRPGCD